MEAQRLNKLSLNHSGIVRVNESFRSNGTAYYVMEYIKGQSLREYVRRSPLGRLPEAEALQLFQPVTETIGYLHDNKVTHLDIKPDNILIRENGEPVVIDFGLSKHYNTKGTPTSTIKAAGCSAGYSPMEQYVGITTFTPEADIYALGATLLYMLTGKDPMISTEINEVVIRKSIPQDVSQQTSDTIVHAMEKLKESRTKTVKELLSRLQGTEKPVHTDTDNKVPNSNPTLRLKKKKIKNDINLNWRKWTIVGLSAVILIGLFYSHSQSSGDKKNIQQEKAISAEKESAKPIEMLSDYSLLRIGDYVYSDGTFSRELSKEKECSGIIFSLETTPNQKKKGWTHGKILALKDAGDAVWGPKDKDFPYKHVEYKYLPEGKYFSALRKDLDSNGLVFSMASDSEKHKEFEAFILAKNFRVARPPKSSPWYLPCVGEIVEFLDNLCNIKLDDKLHTDVKGIKKFNSNYIKQFWREENAHWLSNERYPGSVYSFRIHTFIYNNNNGSFSISLGMSDSPKFKRKIRSICVF